MEASNSFLIFSFSCLEPPTDLGRWCYAQRETYQMTTWGHCTAQEGLSTIGSALRPGWAWLCSLSSWKSLQGVEGLALGLGLVAWHVRECRHEVNIKCLHQHRFASGLLLRLRFLHGKSCGQAPLGALSPRDLHWGPKGTAGSGRGLRFFLSYQKPEGGNRRPDRGMLVDISLVLVCVCGRRVWLAAGLCFLAVPCYTMRSVGISTPWIS